MVGSALAGLVALTTPQLLGWTSPIWASLMLSPAVAWLSARRLTRPAGLVRPAAGATGTLSAA
jgi:membrane glycosyltransferase